MELKNIIMRVKFHWRAGKMAQSLRAPPALKEDLSLAPCTQLPVTPAPKDMMYSKGNPGSIHVPSQRDTHTKTHK